MKYAIIAAGEGSRLAQEGIAAPKPLVEVNGEKLIDRLIRVFTDCGAEEVCVICRATGDALSPVALHLQELQRAGFPLRFIYKATPSSMHSLFELSPMLEGGPFVLTTVDTIFRETEFRSYVAAFERLIADGEADGLMGVTDYIDDEKPLYVKTSGMDITGFLDRDDNPLYISGGIYGLTDRSLRTLRACIERGESRMRNFQRALIADGLRLKAWPFSKVLDIDHASDIRKAEAFLASKPILALTRAPQFSPNSVEKDRAIMQAVADRLRRQGQEVEMVSETTGTTRTADTILSMARLPETLAWLKEQEQQGARVINRPEAVELCSSRCALTRLMQENGIPMPASRLSPLTPHPSPLTPHSSPLTSHLSPLTPPFWLKRGDACAQSEGDVVFCRDEQELEAAIGRFAARGITGYVVSEHVEGDLVKFYGVRGTGFFRCFYPTDDHDTKFGDEQHNGPAVHFAFSVPALRADAERLAQLVGLDVYGGDCIVTLDGTWSIIDFNDWPSFSRCRDEAAEAITSPLS